MVQGFRVWACMILSPSGRGRRTICDKFRLVVCLVPSRRSVGLGVLFSDFPRNSESLCVSTLCSLCWDYVNKSWFPRWRRTLSKPPKRVVYIPELQSLRRLLSYLSLARHPEMFRKISCMPSHENLARPNPTPEKKKKNKVTRI